VRRCDRNQAIDLPSGTTPANGRSRRGVGQIAIIALLARHGEDVAAKLEGRASSDGGRRLRMYFSFDESRQRSADQRPRRLCGVAGRFGSNNVRSQLVRRRLCRRQPMR
jgi:hypothetical protein